MAPKGMSAEEKRKRISEIFKQNNGEVYTLKEIEGIGGKRGIVVQTIKDVLQSLVDDGLVDTDKIGSGNFYWALPSKEGQKKQCKLASLQTSIASVQAALDAEKMRASALLATRAISSERTKKLQLLQNLKQKEATLKNDLQEFADKDPVVLQALQDEIMQNQENANIWTFATASAISLASRESGRSEEDIKVHFEVCDEDLEPLEA